MSTSLSASNPGWPLPSESSIADPMCSEKTERFVEGVSLLQFSQLNNIVSPDDSVEICGIRPVNFIIPLDIVVCYRTPGPTLYTGSMECNRSKHCQE